MLEPAFSGGAEARFGGGPNTPGSDQEIYISTKRIKEMDPGLVS